MIGGSDLKHPGPRGPRGQSLVEFALLLPLMLLLLFAIVDLSSMFRAALVARSAASEAARYMQVVPSATAAEAASHAQASARDARDVSVTVRAGALSTESHYYTAQVRGADGAWHRKVARDNVVTTTFTATASYDTFAAGFIGSPRMTFTVEMPTVQTRTGAI